MLGGMFWGGAATRTAQIRVFCWTSARLSPDLQRCMEIQASLSRRCVSASSVILPILGWRVPPLRCFQFLFGRRLGQGRLGEVRHAIRRSDGESVAVKCVKRNRHSGQEVRLRATVPGCVRAYEARLRSDKAFLASGNPGWKSCDHDARSARVLWIREASVLCSILVLRLQTASCISDAALISGYSTAVSFAGSLAIWQRHEIRHANDRACPKLNGRRTSTASELCLPNAQPRLPPALILHYHRKRACWRKRRC